MSLREARLYAGKVCLIRWKDRNGWEHEVQSRVYNAFGLEQGAVLVTDSVNIPLDRILSLSLVGEPLREAQPAPHMASKQAAA